MRAFAYHAPRSLAEAVAILEREGPGGRVLAGGTDLLVQAKERGIVPPYVVSLRDVADLEDITVGSDGSLVIGARAALVDVAGHPGVRHFHPALATGASLVGSHQIQNRGTVGGNVCNAAPSADTAPPLVAAGATVEAYGPGGRRTILIDEFFIGPGRTSLGSGEVLAAIRVPGPGIRSGSAYARHTPRQEMDIAIVGVAAQVALDAAGAVSSLAIALGAVGPTPLRAHAAEAVAIARVPDDAVVAEVARVAASEARPISDQRGSATYRRHLVEVLARRVVRDAVALARRAA